MKCAPGIHSASLRNAFPYRLCADSCAALNFFRRLDGLAGAMISCLPSVLTSSGVSESILSSSRIGRSITSAMLFPCFVSFLTMRNSVLPMYHQQQVRDREPDCGNRQEFLGTPDLTPEKRSCGRPLRDPRAQSLPAHGAFWRRE